MADNSYYKLYDRRTMDRYVDKGNITKEDREKFLKSLPDETANAQWVEMNLEEAEIAERGSDVNDDEDMTDEDDVDADSDEAT